MNFGNIDSERTRAGRIYAYLRERKGEWISGWQLTMAVETTAVSTRIAEIRAQLEADPERGEMVEHKREGGGHYYRVAPAHAGQIELI